MHETVDNLELSSAGLTVDHFSCVQSACGFLLVHPKNSNFPKGFHCRHLMSLLKIPRRRAACEKYSTFLMIFGLSLRY